MVEETSKETYSLEALKAGDRAEFARLVDEYSGVIYRLGMKMLNMLMIWLLYFQKS